MRWRLREWLVALWLASGAQTMTSACFDSASRRAWRPGAATPSSFERRTSGRNPSAPHQALGQGHEELEEGGDVPEEAGPSAGLRHGEGDAAQHRRIGVPPELALGSAPVLEDEAGAGQ